MTAQKRLRCAIYTRKSSDEGLEQEFNSLDAQREACEAYIKSQAHQGWRLIPDEYDDGGHSGGTLERPALQRLLGEVRARKVDVIVLYKIDRLSRSLADFARLAELFDAHGVSFVSVTQQFNTTTSMGRLMLNVLLSFAQFERELTGERIRDKIAASKKKGLWMGGNVPLGYEPQGRTLVINKDEAEVVRTLFRLYLQKGNVREVKAEVDRLGLTTKLRVFPDGRKTGGVPFSRGHIYRILSSPIYVGEIAHKKETYPGTHAPIIDRTTWQTVQKSLGDNLNGHRMRRSSESRNLLVGLLVDAEGNRFTSSHAMKGDQRYRYYVDRALIAGDQSAKAKIRRIPAHEIEIVVRDALMDLLIAPDRLIEALSESLTATEADGVIRKAHSLHGDIQAAPTTWSERFRPALNQIVLDEESVRIRIARVSLRSMLGIPAGEETEGTTGIYDLIVSTRVRTRGNRLKLIIENSDQPAKREPDSALIRTIAQAHHWLGLLKSGRVSSVQEISALEKVTVSYVTRVMRLACLAPTIIEDVLGCRHPIQVTARRLMLREDLPLEWGEQGRQLEFKKMI